MGVLIRERGNSLMQYAGKDGGTFRISIGKMKRWFKVGPFVGV